MYQIYLSQRRDVQEIGQVAIIVKRERKGVMRENPAAVHVKD